VTYAEEDVWDAANHVVLAFIAFSSICLFWAIGVQLPYMISNAVGEPSWRTYAMDIANLALCSLRVVTCWFRYIFYDFQVDYVDTVLFYNEATNAVELSSWATSPDFGPGMPSQEPTPDLWRLS